MSAGIVAVVFEDNFSKEVLRGVIYWCFFRKKFLNIKQFIFFNKIICFMFVLQFTTMAKYKKKYRKKKQPEDLEPAAMLKNPHDKYVRYVLQSQQVALELIRYALPPDLYQTINPKSIELSNDTFIDEKLRGHYSDICYDAYTLQGKPLRISIIFEHKSHPPDTPVREQLLRYITGAWRKDLLQKRRLSLIIPILVYHGEAPIKKESTEMLFPDAPRELLPYIPTFDYILVDIARIPDSIIEDALHFHILSNIFLALKHGKDADYIGINWKKILIFAPEVQQNEHYLGVFKATFLYIPERQWFAKILLVLSPPACVAKPRQCAALPAFCALAGEPMTAQSFSQTTIVRVYECYFFIFQ